MANIWDMQTSRQSLVRRSHDTETPPMARNIQKSIPDIRTEQFVDYYYKTFDSDRTQLAALYVRLIECAQSSLSVKEGTSF